MHLQSFLMSLFQSEGSCVTAPKMRGKVVILKLAYLVLYVQKSQEERAGLQEEGVGLLGEVEVHQVVGVGVELPH